MWFPIKLNPGVVRRGTLYESRDHWFVTQLVRWHNRVMRAFDGWVPLERTADAVLDACVTVTASGGTTLNETTDANSAGANDFALPIDHTSDRVYFGFKYRFKEVRVNVGTATVGGTLQWEYWNGSAWTTLSGVQDNTNGFHNTGINAVSFTVPFNWEKTTVNSQGPFYYVRTTTLTTGTNGLGTQAWIGRGPVDVDEVVRGLFAWRALNNTPELFLGTPTKAYVYAAGVVEDITPAGFTTGGVDAVLSSGNYGAGAYGVGDYGVGDLAQSNVVEANTWQVDNFGEDLVFVAYSDGKVYYWDKSVGGLATQLSGSPVNCSGVVVTPEKFVMALGADGDGRKIKWPDQATTTVWTTLPSNQAGEFTLPGKGRIVAGARGRRETLIWTDVDMFVAKYVKPPFVYGFPQVGSNCPPISRRSMIVFDGIALWMSKDTFYIYDGNVRPVNCDLADDVFNDLNLIQTSKIHCELRANFGEVLWHYPSSSSTECDKFIGYNYRDGFWFNSTSYKRTSAIGADAFSNPIAVDPKGVVYLHETGSSYLDPDGVAMTPFAESGPFELGNGEKIATLLGMYPDEKTLGGVQMKLYLSNFPTVTGAGAPPETLVGPFIMDNPTTFRESGRQARIRLEQVTTGWRWGTPRFEIEATDER